MAFFFPSVWVMLVGFGLEAWLFLFLGYLFLLLGPATYCVRLINSFCICLSLCLSSRGFPPCPSLSIEATNGSASLCPFNLQCWRALPPFFLLPSLAAISACSGGGCWLDEFWVWFTGLPRLIGALGSLPRKDAPILASCAGCSGFCFVGMGAGRTCLPLQLDLVSMAHSINFDWWEFRYNFQLDLNLIGRPIEDSLC
jgi:hypothetical protein